MAISSLVGFGSFNGLEIKVGQELDRLQSSLELHWVGPVATATRPAVDHVFEPLLGRLDSKVLAVHHFDQWGLSSDNNQNMKRGLNTIFLVDSFSRTFTHIFVIKLFFVLIFTISSSSLAGHNTMGHLTSLTQSTDLIDG